MASPISTTTPQTDRLGLLAEASKRGILPADKRGLYDEAVRRGLIPGVKSSDTSLSPPPYQEMGAAFQKGTKAVTSEIAEGIFQMRGRDHSINYGPGAGFATETALKEADNPEEAAAVLQKIYGKGNYGQDRGGNWWVRKNGQKVSVFGDNSSIWKRLNTSIRSQFPELAGMTVGEEIGGGIAGALGAESGPLDVGISAAGAAVGGAIGKGSQELWKWMTGTLRKTPKEEARTLEINAALSAAGTLGGRALTRMGGYMLRPKELPWIHVTPEMEERTAKALAQGMVPRIDQVTGAKTYRLFIMDQRLMHYVWGDPAVEKNVTALNEQLTKALEKSGVPADKVTDTLNQVIHKNVSVADLNESVVKAVNDYRTGIEKVASDASEKASKHLSKQLDVVDSMLANPKIPLAANVEADITAARQNFSNTAGGLYQVVDELAAGRKLVSTASIKDTIKSIEDTLPKTAEGKILGSQVETPVRSYLHDMTALPDRITLSDAQRIRSSLLQLTRDPGLTPGVGWHELQQITSSVTKSIDEVALNPLDKPVIDALDVANTYYRDGIARFEEVTANRLVKEAGQTGAIDPEMVMRAIIRPGRISQAKRIMQFLRPDTQHQLARDYFQSILQNASDPLNPGSIVGSRLLRYVNQNADMMRTILGGDATSKMQTLAKNMAAFDGKIPVSELGSDGAAQAVKNALEKQAAVDSFMKENYLRALAKPGLDQDRAIDYIIRPGHIDKLRNAISIFGHDSATMKLVRQKLMAKILESSIGTSSDPAEQLFAGNALKDTLHQYGRDYLEEAYGKEMADDLFRLGDTVALISSKPKIGGAVGFVAGVGIMLHPLRHIGKLVGMHILNELMSKPVFLKWLIFGFKGDSMAIRTVNQMVRQAVNMAAQGSAPNTAETPPGDQKQPLAYGQ